MSNDSVPSHLPANHPLTRAKWLWPEGELYLTNCFAQFRHDFELKNVPSPAPLFITADQQYRLYVNGRYVCRGPARGYQHHWPFDEVEVGVYLRTGHNWISVEAYNPGIGTFQYLSCNNAGMLCAAEWDGVKIASAKTDWIMRRSPANKPNVARMSRQLAFQEDYDAAKDDGAWITSPQPPIWKSEERFRWAGEIPFGQLPWFTVEERGLPLLREELRAPLGITSAGTGKMPRGWKNCFNISWFWLEREAPFAVRTSGTEIKTVSRGDWLEFTVEPAGKGNFREVTIALEKISIGSPILEVEGATGREIIDCHFHQSLSNGIPEKLISPQNYGLIGMAVRLRTARGSCRREFFATMGCRDLTLVCRNLTSPLRLRVTWRSAEYPFTMGGNFECSDPLLNRIYAICRNTQQICASDAYMDTPWREQGQWWGDARIQARNTFYLDGDARLLARGIRSIAGQPAPFGLTYGVAPCANEACILPDFSLTWILTIYDHWMQTGSLALFQEFHDRIRQIFDYFASLSHNGIIHADSRFWLFEDWADLPKTGFPTFLNLWHLYTLEHYSLLLDAAGLDSTENRQKAAYLRQRITETFYDPQTQLLIPGVNKDGAKMSPPSVHDQALAILLDLLPEAHHTMRTQRILPFLQGRPVAGATPSSFWCSYLFEAADKLGCRREVLAFIRRHWGRMVPSGGTWERLTWDETNGESCCHAWSAHPSFHLIHILSGLYQQAPAWREVRWQPPTPENLEWVKGVVPTPRGPLVAAWRQNHERIRYRIEIPEGITVRAQLSEQPEQILTSGVYQFEDSIPQKEIVYETR